MALYEVCNGAFLNSSEFKYLGRAVIDRKVINEKLGQG
jgi:hypothetical protein